MDKSINLTLHDCCKSWCRDWRETEEWKLPSSDHSPGCVNFKRERFTELRYDGAACIMEPAEAADVIRDGDTEYEVCDIYLTRDQFEKLDEFTGF